MISYKYFDTSVHDFNHDCFLFVLSNKIESKSDLLLEISRGLNFPNYFGNNWDALEECLCDLSWITEKSICIIHRALPRLKEDELEIYLSILGDLKNVWHSDNLHEIVIYFPKSEKENIVKYFQ
ncbi:MAG: barstar family protein [Sphingobacteriales bacterium]|nr:barstar family protein [Sphingobacteriales bacterium]